MTNRAAYTVGNRQKKKTKESFATNLNNGKMKGEGRLSLLLSFCTENHFDGKF